MSRPYEVEAGPGRYYRVSRRCLMCNAENSALVTGEQLFAREHRGAKMQDAFPDLVPSMREALFGSGICCLTNQC